MAFLKPVPAQPDRTACMATTPAYQGVLAATSLRAHPPATEQLGTHNVQLVALPTCMPWPSLAGRPAARRCEVWCGNLSCGGGGAGAEAYACAPLDECFAFLGKVRVCQAAAGSADVAIGDVARGRAVDLPREHAARGLEHSRPKREEASAALRHERYDVALEALWADEHQAHDVENGIDRSSSANGNKHWAPPLCGKLKTVDKSS
eukprot:CAMPEP_0183462616 /NCGR_PEP_ID=MMETSP0370-20130417/142019_1 /TAXON_ID=268820 /ORGANISM="Peridinium aciculiferum, Strain PAER-2" /LENGTH=205 /DNA_ID=CAMNT_0025654655 /DNA_START=26 /DNA_END=646 /DNA_ORIENTATION=-